MSIPMQRVSSASHPSAPSMDPSRGASTAEGWASVPGDVLLLVLHHAMQASYKAARATCAAWRAAIDCSLWRSASADLRNTKLGALPQACRQSLHLQRVELSFNGSSTVVSELGSLADSTAFMKSLGRLQLHKYGRKLQQGSAISSLCKAGPRQAQRSGSVLVLNFGNYCVHASTVESLLRAVEPAILDAWPSLEIYASALPGLWPGQSCRAGLLLDGGLTGHLTATGTTLGIQLRGRSGGAEAAGKLPHEGTWQLALRSPHAYRRLVRCCLPVRGTALSLVPAGSCGTTSSSSGRTAGWSSSAWAAEGHDAAAQLAAAAPGLRVLRLAGPCTSEGLGARSGGCLRPEHIAFCCMPLSIEEVEFVGVEMPRVHYSSTHFKPWEAVLLVDTADYLLQHFVKPLAAAFPWLRVVRCLGTRVPEGTFGTTPVEACTRLLTSAAWPLALASPQEASGGLVQEVPGGAVGGQGPVPAGEHTAVAPVSDALWTFTWAGAELRRASGSSIQRQVWQVLWTPCASSVDILVAADGLRVEQCDVVFVREI